MDRRHVTEIGRRTDVSSCEYQDCHHSQRSTMTIPLYPPIVKENDLSPAAFGHETDVYCEEIHVSKKEAVEKCF